MLRMNQSPMADLVDSSADEVILFRVSWPISPMLAMGCGDRGNQGSFESREVTSREGMRRASLRVLAQAGEP